MAVGIMAKRIVKHAARRVKPEEAVEVLQILAAYIFGLALLLGSHARHAAVGKHLAYVLRNPVNHLPEGYHKRILVAVAEWHVVYDVPYHPCVCIGAVGLADGRVLGVERHKPVANAVEKRETLHLREAAEIYVGARLLHVEHPPEALFHLLHPAFGLLRVDYVFDGVALFLFYSVWCYAQAVVLQQVGHYLLLYLAVVVLGAEAVEQLYLQLYELLANMLVGQQAAHHLALFREYMVHPHTRRQGPAHQRPLAHLLVGALPVDGEHHPELVYVKHVHAAQHHCRHNELLVDCVNRGSQEQLSHRLGGAVGPLRRRPDVIKQVIHHLPVNPVQPLLLLGTHVGRLEFEQCHVRYKAFKPGLQGCRRPVAAGRPDTVVYCSQV